MTYKREHFSNCRFNPFDVVKFCGDEKLGKYIICLYDPASPLIRTEQNIEKRIKAATEIAGQTFDHKEETFVQSVQDYLQNYAKSMEWALIRSLEETYWEFIQRLRQPIKDEKDTDSMRATAAKTKMSQDAKEILDIYRAENAKFYNNDTQLIEATGKIRQFNPETVAKAAKNV